MVLVTPTFIFLLDSYQMQCDNIDKIPRDENFKIDLYTKIILMFAFHSLILFNFLQCKKVQLSSLMKQRVLVSLSQMMVVKKSSFT